MSALVISKRSMRDSSFGPALSMVCSSTRKGYVQVIINNLEGAVAFLDNDKAPSQVLT